MSDSSQQSPLGSMDDNFGKDSDSESTDNPFNIDYIKKKDHDLHAYLSMPENHHLLVEYTSPEVIEFGVDLRNAMPVPGTSTFSFIPVPGFSDSHDTFILIQRSPGGPGATTAKEFAAIAEGLQHISSEKPIFLLSDNGPGKDYSLTYAYGPHERKKIDEAREPIETHLNVVLRFRDPNDKVIIKRILELGFVPHSAVKGETTTLVESFKIFQSLQNPREI